MRYCAHIGCRTLVHRGRCPAHERPAWRSEGQAETTRIRGRQLQRMRFDLWRKDPHCRACRRLVRFENAIRDHIVNLREGGQDVESNTQILCRGCSDEKTARESQRGKQRVRV